MSRPSLLPPSPRQLLTAFYRGPDIHFIITSRWTTRTAATRSQAQRLNVSPYTARSICRVTFRVIAQRSTGATSSRATMMSNLLGPADDRTNTPGSILNQTVARHMATKQERRMGIALYHHCRKTLQRPDQVRLTSLPRLSNSKFVAWPATLTPRRLMATVQLDPHRHRRQLRLPPEDCPLVWNTLRPERYYRNAVRHQVPSLDLLACTATGRNANVLVTGRVANARKMAKLVYPRSDSTNDPTHRQGLNLMHRRKVTQTTQLQLPRGKDRLQQSLSAMNRNERRL